jgi:hypothetical protein
MKPSFLKPHHWGLILTLLLCSFALLPLLRQAGLPAGYDVRYHVYRVAEMDRQWQAGLYMPRWADSFYYGYGYPVFHYYASSTYYLTSSLMAVLDWTPLEALRAVIALAFWGAGAGMYRWLSCYTGPLGGLIAALVYVYCPYILYTEPYTRGDYPELLAFALAPWLFGSFDRLTLPEARLWRYRLRLVLACGSVALLIITHNLMAVVFFALLLGWILWLALMGSLGREQFIVWMACAGLGVGLAAYFWLPVLLERHEVQLQNLIDVAELDYRRFFIPLGTLLDSTTRADAEALNGLIPRYNIGWAAAILAGAGILSLLWRWRKNSDSRSFALASHLYFALVGFLMAFLITPHSSALWEVVSPLAYLQFPWRFLGPVACCAAILSSANAHWIQGLGRAGRISLSIGAGLLILGLAIPKLYVPQWELTTLDTSVATYQQLEVAGLQRGTTFSGEFLPQTVQVVPTANERLLADFADGRPIDHLHYEALPDGVTAQLIDQSPQYHQWRVSAPQGFTLEVLIFDFAGWHAQVNGQVVPITPAIPHGLITFPVPEGESVVTLRMASTPPRNLGYAISGIAVLGLLGLLWRGPRWAITEQNTASSLPIQSTGELLAVGLGIAILFAVLLGLVFRPGLAWYESPPGQALPAQHPTEYRLGDSMRLLGYDLSSESLAPGGRLEVSLYWYAQQPPQAGYASFVHITSGGPPQAQSDRQNPGGVPSLEWSPAGYIVDTHVIFLPDTIPPGEYEIRVGLWTCDGLPAGQACGNGLRPPVIDGVGNALGDSIPLAVINVK